MLIPLGNGFRAETRRVGVGVDSDDTRIPFERDVLKR